MMQSRNAPSIVVLSDVLNKNMGGIFKNLQKAL
jgi:hypothetical protein